MAKLPYIKEYTDDCGIRRRYFRRKGFKGGALPGRTGSPEFMAAYQSYMVGAPAKARVDRSAKGTFGGLIAEYYRSIEYANLKPSSKQLYRYALEPLREQHGHRPLQTMTRENLVGIIERVGARAPGMANLTRAVLQKMLKIALDRGQISSNPLAQKVTAYKSGSHHTWTDAELAQFEARWPLGTRQRLAYALLFYTGQRSGDVVRMRRADIASGAIRVVQEKTGVELSIQIHPDLSEAIKAGPTKGLNLIGDDLSEIFKRYYEWQWPPNSSVSWRSKSFHFNWSKSAGAPIIELDLDPPLYAAAIDWVFADFNIWLPSPPANQASNTV